MDYGDLLRVVDTLSKENSMEEFYEWMSPDLWGYPYLHGEDCQRLAVLPPESEVLVYLGLTYDVAGVVYEYDFPQKMTAGEAMKLFKLH
jgi:hypothetical protein